eukprot:1122548-Pelagomonas_calceolata.AAC.1
MIKETGKRKTFCPQTEPRQKADPTDTKTVLVTKKGGCASSKESGHSRYRKAKSKEAASRTKGSQ